DCARGGGLRTGRPGGRRARHRVAGPRTGGQDDSRAHGDGNHPTPDHTAMLTPRRARRNPRTPDPRSLPLYAGGELRRSVVPLPRPVLALWAATAVLVAVHLFQ